MQIKFKKVVRVARQILIAVVVVIVLWSVLSMLFEKQFIFFPDKYPSGYYNEASRISNLVDCWITTEDSIKLHGWYASSNNAIATLVIAHGNAGNISYRLELLSALQRSGFNVMMFDYRGYGRSDGSPSEDGIYKDGKAAFDYVLHLPRVDSQRIILWGTSLGGAVAIDIALHRPAAGLILESTFTSIKDMAAIHYPFLPARYLLRTKLNSIDKISQVHIPVLIIHGTRDGIVPIRFGKELFAVANEPKEFYEIPNADHNNTYFVGGTQYFQRIRAFVLKSLPNQKY